MNSGSIALVHGVLVLLIIQVVCISCAKKPGRRSVAIPTETAKVLVTKEGKVFFRDREVTMDQLKIELRALKEKRGAVWLVDEAPLGQGEPVKRAIIAAELPFRVR